LTTSTTQQDELTAGSAPYGERRITEYRTDDAAAVAEMFNGSQDGWPGGFGGGQHFTAEMVRDYVDSDRPLAVFLSWDGDTCAGWCSFCEYPEERGVAGYVDLLNSASAFRGRGHGRDLLRAALQRTIDLGYRRLDLHTWDGNMRAVPLYKKSGYFWAPDTHVHMENYLPLLLGTPALADFWRDADWYQSYVRDLSVKEDLFLDGKMRIYPYEFHHDNRFVKATIDAAARGLTGLETERWRISCRVDDRRLIVGRPRTARWEVENHSGRPLSLTLSAQGAAGLRLVKDATVTIDDRYVTEAPVIVEDGYQTPAYGQRSPRVESLVLIDGLPMRLETGVEVKQPVELRLAPRRLSLPVGEAREVVLQVKSNLDDQATVTLTLVPSPGLALETTGGEGKTADSAIELPIEAESYAGATPRLRALEAGAQELEVHATVSIGEERIAMVPVRLPAPVIARGATVAFQTERPRGDHAERDVRERELRVETATHRLVVALREGQFHLEDAATGAHLAGGMVSAGPPFAWNLQERVVHEVSVEQQPGAATVRLRGATPHLTSAVVEHELHLSTDGLLRISTAITNTGHAPLEAQAALDIHAGHLPRAILPTRYGLVRTEDPEFPDWGDIHLKQPSMFGEGWTAREGEGKVAGLLWSEASRIDVGRWNLASLRQGEGVLAPGARRVLSPIYLYTGPGDWQTVRALWRNLLAPDAPRVAPPARAVVALEGEVAPEVLLAGRANQVRLSNLGSRAIEGELHWDVPDGWTLNPTSAEVSDLSIGKDQELTATVSHAGGRPGAAAVRAALHGERATQRVFDGASIDLGVASSAVAIREETRDGHRLLTVDNGHLRFRLAPEFMGSIVALETVDDGVNHALSAFPAPREFGWMRPWYGGIHAAVYSPGQGWFASAARLYEERFEVGPAEEAGHDGRTWRGLAVRGMLRSKGLKGLELRATYLTTAGSNLLAARVAVCNHTGATLTVDAALVAYLQPGGTVEDAELLLDREGRQRLHRMQRTITVRGEELAVVRNSRNGRSVAIVCCRGEADPHVQRMDWGALGAHGGVTAGLRLGPLEEKSFLAFVALAQDEAEADAYRALTGARGLP